MTYRDDNLYLAYSLNRNMSYYYVYMWPHIYIFILLYIIYVIVLRICCDCFFIVFLFCFCEVRGCCKCTLKIIRNVGNGKFVFIFFIYLLAFILRSYI